MGENRSFPLYYQPKPEYPCVKLHSQQQFEFGSDSEVHGMTWKYSESIRIGSDIVFSFGKYSEYRMVFSECRKISFEMYAYRHNSRNKASQRRELKLTVNDKCIDNIYWPAKERLQSNLFIVL